MSAETFEDSKKYVDTHAPEAFAAHVLLKRRDWFWKVSRPGSWTYGFFVTLGPGAVMMYGDVGEATLRMNGGSEEEVLQWVLRCSSDPSYVKGKIANREAYRRFYPGDAVKYCQDRVKELDRGPDCDKAKDLLNLVSEAAADGELTAERFYHMCHEAEQYEMPSCENWSSSAFWLTHALKTFARLYVADGEKMAVSTGQHRG